MPPGADQIAGRDGGGGPSACRGAVASRPAETRSNAEASSRATVAELIGARSAISKRMRRGFSARNHHKPDPLKCRDTSFPRPSPPRRESPDILARFAPPEPERGIYAASTLPKLWTSKRNKCRAPKIRFMAGEQVRKEQGASHEPENPSADFQPVTIFRFMAGEQVPKEQEASHEPIKFRR